MNYWGHAVASNIGVIVLSISIFILGKPIMSMVGFLVFFFGFTFADQDLKFGVHRHWFFHSAIPCVLGLIILGWVLATDAPAFRREAMGTAMFCMSHGIHLAGDMKFDNKKKSGTYLIVIRKGDRMGIDNTDRWLFSNALVSVVMAASLVTWG